MSEHIDPVHLVVQRVEADLAATGWNDLCRAGFAPAEETQLPRRTE
jgi:hypothetical protein